MTVFIAHAESDRAVAEALEKFLERRGLFVELETGERGFRVAQASDTVVALWSKDTAFSPYRLLLEKRALEAWADEKLALVKLDHNFISVGLRDLPAIDASFEAQRDIAWAAVAKLGQDGPARAASASGARERARVPAGMSPGPAQRSKVAAPRAPAKQANSAAFAVILLPLVFLVAGAGLYALATLRPDLLRTALPPNAYQGILPIGGALLAFVLIGLMFVFARASRAAGGAAETVDATPAHDPLFVSYAHADNMAVVPVVEAVQAQGRTVWIDKGELHAGTSWAGEIVRAIKAAKGVIVMCSAHAFESDHVKREVYLADRYKKPMLPVFLEAATMPEDFEYFFTGVQWLELHKTPENERAAAIANALKAV